MKLGRNGAGGGARSRGCAGLKLEGRGPGCASARRQRRDLDTRHQRRRGRRTWSEQSAKPGEKSHMLGANPFAVSFAPRSAGFQARREWEWEWDRPCAQESSSSAFTFGSSCDRREARGPAGGRRSWEGRACFDFALRTRVVHQGPSHTMSCGDPRVVLVRATWCATAQTNNDLGDAWPGNRHRGGTPRHDGLKNHPRPFPNSKCSNGGCLHSDNPGRHQPPG